MSKPGAQGKGQTNLFSFFKKPAVPTTGADSLAPQPTNNSSSNGALSKVSENVVADTTAETPWTKNHGKPEIKKRVIMDDEEESFGSAPVVANPSTSPTSSKPSPAKRARGNANAPTSLRAKDDDDPLVDSEDEGTGSEEESEASGFSDDSDDSDDSELVDSSEEDDDYAARKRRRGNKSPATSKTTKPKSSVSSDSALKTPSKKLSPASVSVSSASVASFGKKPPLTTPSFGGPSGAKTPNSAGLPQPSMFCTPTPSSKLSTPTSHGSNDGDVSMAGGGEVSATGVYMMGAHEHNKWDFLKPGSIKDKAGRRPDHPDYNPRSCQVPASFLNGQTPAMRQWCEFKFENMDTVLFFKVGKFYELFHMDADIGVHHLELIYMKGEKAHSGFPEISYGKYATGLIAKGFRVARVEQTETPEQLKERNDSASKGSKKDKVVAREMCSILSRGTRTYSHMDDLTALNETVNSLTSNSSAPQFDLPPESILMCIREKLILATATPAAPMDTEAPECTPNSTSDDLYADDSYDAVLSKPAVVEYGVCIADTVLGDITFAQFHDDEQRTRLRTLLAQFNPSEIVLHHNNFSDATTGAIKLVCPKVAWEFLRGSEMPSARETVKMLREGGYFMVKKSVAAALPPNSPYYATWPSVIQQVVQGLAPSSVDSSAASNQFTSDLVMSAFGGIVWQLRRSLIDLQIVSFGKCHGYVPPDAESTGHGELTPASAQYGEATADACFQLSSQTSSQSSTAESLLLMTQDDQELEEQKNVSTAAVTPVSTASEPMEGTESSANHTKPDTAPSAPPATNSAIKCMTLDAVALANLEILVNNYDKTSKGSLWQFINRTKTPFGRRLLHNWVCKPLYNIAEIRLRTAAVEDLLSVLSVEAGRAANYMHSLPDLERLLSRVHCNGLKKKSLEHPDSRAIMYEGPIYNNRKIKDFADVLSGFETVLKVMDSFRGKDGLMNSDLLKRISQSAKSTRGGRFPAEQMTELLQYFRSIFDEKQAKRDGNIKPLPGVDAEYDKAKADIATIETNLQNYLKEMKRSTGINELVFWGSNKDRYQIEVPMSKTGRLPANWSTKSQKKTHRRYWTPTIEKLFGELMQAEDAMAMAQKDTMRRIFEKFDGNISVWILGVNCVAILDALMSLAMVSASPNYSWPVMVAKGKGSSGAGVCNVPVKPFIHIENGRHPMLEQTLAEKSNDGTSYIPNTVILGGVRNNGAMDASAADATTQEQQGRDYYTYTATQDDNCFGSSSKSTSANAGVEHIPRALVLSGPNMGGKSTLLRQTCLIAIMAQLGCKVPADRCVMTPIDRIFTRVGASDKILSGQSTFYVELAETANILLSATEDSLCILDELGRGTATFDGTAIAHAVLHHIVNLVKCRTMFATHYHSLVEDWSVDPRVHLGHMDCIVQGAADGDTAASAPKDADRTEQVTFLYKLCDGSSPRSYGINVARLAKLPLRVIEIAMRQSREFENSMNNTMQLHHQQQEKQLQELNTGSGGATPEGFRYLNKNTMVSFYCKLLGILRCEGIAKSPSCTDSDAELVYVVQELWRRFNHMVNK